MADTLNPLITDFLTWLDREQRSYADVMDTWRTSCPRLTVWEDAIDLDLISREHHAGTTQIVLTARGRAFLADAPTAAI